MERAKKQNMFRPRLAQAKRLEAIASTADRPWAAFAATLDVRIELIR